MIWAGALAQRLGSLDLASLQNAYTDEEALKHRATLKSHLDDALQQLVRLVMERRDTLKGTP